MSSSSSIKCFRTLMRARRVAFAGDPAAMQAAAERIRVEFEKNRGVTDAAAISKLLKIGQSARDLLVKNVAQARLTERGTYALHVDPKRHEINDYSSSNC